MELVLLLILIILERDKELETLKKILSKYTNPDRIRKYQEKNKEKIAIYQKNYKLRMKEIKKLKDST